MLKRINCGINDNYGSRRGLLNHCLFSVQHHLGFFKRHTEVDWAQVERLIFVCQGNICRSPMAEAVAKKIGASADSYGLLCRDGAPADERAIKYAEAVGLSLLEHTTKNIRHYSPQASDLVVGMEPHHMAPLLEFSKNAQVTLAGLWATKAHPYIHDPYSASDTFFLRSQAAVQAATAKLI